MIELVRRSNLLVPLTDLPGVEGAWRHNADAVTLDLADGVPASRRVEARSQVQEAISQVARGGAEVFVRAGKPFLVADLEASVWPGLSGVVLSAVGSAADVARAAEVLDDLEGHRGLEPGSLQIIPFIQSALGVWQAREIVCASRRVAQVALDEGGLAAEAGFLPLEQYDPFVYARGRLVIEATAVQVQPVGMAHPLSGLPQVLPAEQIHQHATNARNLGFKGVLCPHASWVEPVNQAFTPRPELVDYYSQVRQVFAQALAAGTAAVPFHGRMIDVPVDEWAKVVLRQSELCAARDQEKRMALQEAT